MGRYLKPSRKLLYYATRLSAYAHRDWVVGFFFLLYFFDSFLIFLPAESFLALTLLFVPDRKRVWVLAAITGALSGFILFYLLSLSSFQPKLIEFIESKSLAESFALVVNYGTRYGYPSLVALVFIAVPPLVGLVAGILIGLNPLIVFVIVFLAKIFRILTMICVMRFAKRHVLRVRGKLAERKERKLKEKEFET